MNRYNIDRAAIDRLLAVIGGGADDLLELVEEFRESSPGILGKMRHAAANSDIDALRISAHSLKSNGRDFGATTLAKLCEDLERACRSGTLSDPEQQVEAISDELDLAREALVRLVSADE